MTCRRGFPAKACLALGLVAGLTACGGGGSYAGSGSTGSPPETPAGETIIHAQEITITPPANRPPRIVGSIPAQTLTEGGNARSVDVAPYFSDPDGDPLTFSAQSGDPGIVMVGISGATVTLTPVSAGTATVTVTASDGNGEAVQSIVVTVRQRQSSPATGQQSVNRAPEESGSIPAQTLTEGGNARSVDVAPYFSDPDGDPLTFSAQSGDPGIVMVGISGATVTLTPVSAGTATVTVTASDGNGEAVQSIVVTVRQRQSSPATGQQSVNRAPEESGSIPAQTLTEGGNARSVDVAPYFSDPDGDPLTFSAQSGDPGIVMVGISGATVTLTPVSAGTATVTVTASDGNGEAVQSIVVTVRQRQSSPATGQQSVNRAPEESGSIPAQTLTEGGNARSVDVAPYFSDPDGDPLTFSAQSGDPGIVMVGISGATVTLTPVSAGTATVTVTASDGNGEAVQSIVVTVRQRQSSPATGQQSVNRAPEESGSIPAQTLTEGGNARSVDVAPYFSDPDGDPLTFSAQSGDPGIVMVGISGATVTLTPVSAGTATVTVLAGDGNVEAVQVFTVMVQEQNTGPDNGPDRGQEDKKDSGTTNQLTGLRIDFENGSAREVALFAQPKPDGAGWTGIRFNVNPFEAGYFCCFVNSNTTTGFYLDFRCEQGYTGVVTATITVNDINIGKAVSESFSYTCR